MEANADIVIVNFASTRQQQVHITYLSVEDKEPTRSILRGEVHALGDPIELAVRPHQVSSNELKQRWLRRLCDDTHHHLSSASPSSNSPSRHCIEPYLFLARLLIVSTTHGKGLSSGCRARVLDLCLLRLALRQSAAHRKLCWTSSTARATGTPMVVHLIVGSTYAAAIAVLLSWTGCTTRFVDATVHRITALCDVRIKERLIETAG